MEAPSKVFLLFFLLPDWLKLNHLKSRMECGFSDIFSRHFCSTVAETIGVTINPASFGAKNCSETTFEAAEMILGPWNQQHKQNRKPYSARAFLVILSPGRGVWSPFLILYLTFNQLETWYISRYVQKIPTNKKLLSYF